MAGVPFLFHLFHRKGAIIQTSRSSEVSKLSLLDVPKETWGLVVPEKVKLVSSCGMLQLTYESKLIIFKEFLWAGWCPFTRLNSMVEIFTAEKLAITINQASPPLPPPPKKSQLLNTLPVYQWLSIFFDTFYVNESF